LDFALRRVQLGDSARFFQDFYGRQWAELQRGWDRVPVSGVGALVMA
jgi:hypothetical protein